jgi:hypothetical protein
MSDANEIPTTDGSATGAVDPQPDLLRKIESATDRAVDQHNSETKRRPGQRGPDKQKRKSKLPLGRLVDGPSSPLSAPDAPLDDSPGWSDDPPIVDEETAKAFATTTVELFKDGRAQFNKLLALRATGDPEVAAAAVPQMSASLEKSLDHSALLCWRKWLAKMQLEPEFMLFGTMGIIAMSDWIKLRMLAKQAAKMRGPAPLEQPR